MTDPTQPIATAARSSLSEPCPVCWLVGPCDCEGIASVERTPEPVIVRPRVAPRPTVPARITVESTQPIALTAVKLAGDYLLLLATAGHPPVVSTGTIGRQSNVHGIPGGTTHHDLSREVRDVLWGYAEVVADVRSLDGDVWSDDVQGNARRVMDHADALSDVEPLPCTGHAHSPDDTGPRYHPDIARHLACVAARVRLRVEPAGARVLVGLCPTDDCGQPLRANSGAVWCVNDHVHDTATVRSLAVAEASKRTYTLRDVARMSPTLWGRRVKHSWLEEAVRRDRLVTTRDAKGRHIVRVQDVAALVVHGA